jgi:hypothetical protein
MRLSDISRHFLWMPEKWVTAVAFGLPLFWPRFACRPTRTVPLQLYVSQFLVLNEYLLLTTWNSRKQLDWERRKVCIMPCARRMLQFAHINRWPNMNQPEELRLLWGWCIQNAERNRKTGQDWKCGTRNGSMEWILQWNGNVEGNGKVCYYTVVYCNVL